MKETPQQLYNKIQDIGTIRDQLVWEEARMLFELRESGGFKTIFGNDGEETWNSFIKQTNIPLSTVEMKIRLHDFYVRQMHIPVKTLSKIHTRKLDRAITAIKEKKTTIIDVLDIAPKLSFLEFKRWLDEINKG